MYSLEFGDSKVRTDKDDSFWKDLMAYTDPCCILHFRQCYAGQDVKSIAKRTERKVTGCTQTIDYSSKEVGKENQLDIPDYKFNGPVVMAVPSIETNEKGERVVKVEVNWYWQYKPGELGTDKQPY